MKEIHHRMPIILPKDKEDEWIKPIKQQPLEAQQFLLNMTDDELTAYNVRNYVNAAKHNDSQCIEPIA